MKEIFYTLQGEGANAGRPAVFCRFAGCNLWSGHEEDRATAVCTFCDTDFVGTDGPGGGRFGGPEELADAIEGEWAPGDYGRRFVVFTGGEPLLQMDEALASAVHSRGFTIAVETNGTKPVPANVDWICVSPKPTGELVQKAGNELKFVFPQASLDPSDFESLEFEHFFIQPMAGPEQSANLRKSIEFCLANPQWRLSLQTHKVLGMP